jgi:branched-chain amino acid transport system permease protein
MDLARQCDQGKVGILLNRRSQGYDAGFEQLGNIGGTVILLLAATCLPFVLKGYQLFQVSLALSYAVTLLGLNLLTGWTGQISIGHGAFVAVGAYVAAFAVAKLGSPYVVAILLAIVICFAVGLAFGIPALRFEGHHLALMTFVLAIFLPQLLKAERFVPLTGGVNGITLKKPLPPEWLPVNSDLFLYMISCSILAVGFFLAWNLGRGRIGRALLAIREHPTAAAAMGVNVAFFKIMVFGISAAFAGAGGALGALLVQYVSPDSFTLFLSISLLVGIVVGGLGSVSGALFGGFFILFVPSIAENVSKAMPWTVYGAFLIALMFLAPDGIAGLVGRLGHWIVEQVVSRNSRSRGTE